MARFSAVNRRWNKTGQRPPDAFAPVVGGDERDCPVGLADPLDDGRQYVRQLRGYDQKSLLICLGGDDLQQGDDLAGGGQPVLDQAVVADLQEFLDPDAREPQDLDGSRRNPQTARSRRDREVPESFVTVTHPFHPLSGQRLRVLFERKLAGGLAVSCEGGPLGSLMVPLAWTDRGPAAADAPLTYEVLSTWPR